ncbi:MAG: hypothetical protein AAFP76_13975 [Bacteroidota bacterium]
MRNSINKSIISLLFLSAFLFLRVANAHAFSHFSDDADEAHCELCEIIVASQELTPFVGQASVEIGNDNAIFVENDQSNSGYVVPLQSIVYPDFVYNKPPPFSWVLC